MIIHYTCNEQGVPVPEPDIQKFLLWFALVNRKVADDNIGPVHISTIFLGVSSNLHGPPVLWETMVMGGPFEYFQRRCAGSREQAEAMHAEALAMVVERMDSGH